MVIDAEIEANEQRLKATAQMGTPFRAQGAAWRGHSFDYAKRATLDEVRCIEVLHWYWEQKELESQRDSGARMNALLRHGDFGLRADVHESNLEEAKAALSRLKRATPWRP